MEILVHNFFVCFVCWDFWCMLAPQWWRNVQLVCTCNVNQIMYLKWALQYVHMRGEMNSNRYETSFRLKISLQCSVSSLLVFTWIEAKWNSKSYGFHIGNFDRNDVSNWHGISMWTKFTQSEMNKRRLVGYCV